MAKFSMLLRADGYRVVHWAYFKWMVLSSIFLALIGTLILHFLNTLDARSMSLSHILYGLSLLLVFGLYLVMIGVDLACSEHYKHNTLKNEISFGLSRAKIYLSRWTTAVWVMGVLLFCLLASFFLFSTLLLGLPDASSPLPPLGELMQEFALSLLAAFPLWLGALSVGMCLFFLLHSELLIVGIYLFVMWGFPFLLDKLGALLHPFFGTLSQFTLSAPFSQLFGLDVSFALIGRCWAIGLGWTVLATMLGIGLFAQREI